MRLALVHAVDEPQLGEPGVGQLAGGQRARDDADDLDAGGQRGVGQHAHQPDRAAAVHQAEAAPGQLGGERARGLRVLGPRAGRRAAEDADARHGVAGVSQASANSALSAPV